MKTSAILTVTSLLSTILFSIHVTDDIVRGMSEGGRENMILILILIVYLYGIFMLAERWLGKVILLLGGLASAAMPILHARGASHSGPIASSSGGFFFIWTVLALGTTGAFSAILAVHELFRPSNRADMIAAGHESPDRRR